MKRVQTIDDYVELILMKPVNFNASSDYKWIVEDMLSRGHVTTLHGSVCTGKTQLAQRIMTSVASGMPFFGRKTTQGRAYAIMCEEDYDLLLLRQSNISACQGACLQELPNIKIVAPSSGNNILMTFDEYGFGVTTKFFNTLCDDILKFKPDLVVLDSTHTLFGMMDDQDEMRVSEFIRNVCKKIAKAANVAVLLCVHSNLKMELGTTTPWSNFALSSWYLQETEAASYILAGEGHRLRRIEVEKDYYYIT